jgi:hypothetical protein
MLTRQNQLNTAWLTWIDTRASELKPQKVTRQIRLACTG